MQESAPSRTALAAAIHRASHQVLDGGRVFADPLAIAVLARDAPTFETEARSASGRPAMRLFVASRSRVAETALAEGVERRGVRQLVVLGAGLDTFALRNPFADRLRVFEVDHPATQAWKRRRLGEAGLAPPSNLVFAPVDFERDGLMERLEAVGFEADVRSFFMWLGVVVYLTEPAIISTLRLIADLPGGAEVVFDYSDPPDSLTPERRADRARRAALVAAAGEPFLSHFDPVDLHTRLRALGFARIEDFGPPELASRFSLSEDRPAPERGGHVLFAATQWHEEQRQFPTRR